MLFFDGFARMDDCWESRTVFLRPEIWVPNALLYRLLKPVMLEVLLRRDIVSPFVDCCS